MRDFVALFLHLIVRNRAAHSSQWRTVIVAESVLVEQQLCNPEINAAETEQIITTSCVILSARPSEILQPDPPADCEQYEN
jgi:hypothetical protein